MVSFNQDMDKYLDKRKSPDIIPAHSNKPKKKRSKKLAALLRLKDAIKFLLDADEVINFTDLDEKNNVTIYEKKNISDRLTDFINQSRSVKVGFPIKEIEDDKDRISQDEVFKGTGINPTEFQEQNDKEVLRSREPTKNILKIEQVRDSPLGNVFEKISETEQKIHEKIHNRDIPQRRVEKVLKDSRIRDDDEDLISNFSERSQYREDLREIIKIMYRLVKKVPPETLKAFKESDDYRLFVKILDRYDLIRK